MTAGLEELQIKIRRGGTECFRQNAIFAKRKRMCGRYSELTALIGPSDLTHISLP